MKGPFIELEIDFRKRLIGDEKNRTADFVTLTMSHSALSNGQ